MPIESRRMRAQTSARTEVSIDDITVFLAQEEDIQELKNRMEAAARSPGRFVDFVASGGRLVSALITPRTRVVISVWPDGSVSPEIAPPDIPEWDL